MIESDRIYNWHLMIKCIITYSESILNWTRNYIGAIEFLETLRQRWIILYVSLSEVK